MSIFCIQYNKYIACLLWWDFNFDRFKLKKYSHLPSFFTSINFIEKSNNVTLMCTQFMWISVQYRLRLAKLIKIEMHLESLSFLFGVSSTFHAKKIRGKCPSLVCHPEWSILLSSMVVFFLHSFDQYWAAIGRLGINFDQQSKSLND